MSLATHQHESARGTYGMCPPRPEPHPSPASPPQPSGLSQSTGFECPASFLELALIIYFTYGNVPVSMLFSQIIHL